jgi:hypothetical protein
MFIADKGDALLENQQKCICIFEVPKIFDFREPTDNFVSVFGTTLGGLRETNAVGAGNPRFPSMSALN